MTEILNSSSQKCNTKKALSCSFDLKKKRQSIYLAHCGNGSSFIYVYFFAIPLTRLEAVVALPAHSHLLVDLQFWNLRLSMIL